MMLSSLDVLTIFWRATWQAAILAAVVFLLCRVFSRSISASAKTLLWTLPILRLLVLVVPASSLSIYNTLRLLNGFESVAAYKEHTNHPSRPSSNSQALREITPSDETKRSQHIADLATETIEGRQAAESPVVLNSGANSISLMDGIATIWMIGIAVFLVRYFGNQIVLQKIIASGRVVRVNELLKQSIAVELSSKWLRRTRFIVVEENLGPAVTGIFCPVIFLPKQMVACCSQDELRMVILHELEHVRRHDTILMFIAQMASIVHWCNPLVYWLKRRVQAQAEIAVDAATLRKLGVGNVTKYAELLLKIASLNRTPAYVLSMARKSATFRQRIEQLAEIEQPKPLRTFVGVVATVSVALTGLSDVASQERTPTAVREVVVPTETQEKGTMRDANFTAKKPPEPKPFEASNEDRVRTVSGRVVDSQGNGIPNANLFSPSWVDGKKADRRTTTDQNGEFVMSFPPKTGIFETLHTWVYADGFGLRVVSMDNALKNEGNATDVAIPLPRRATKPTHVQVLDPNGSPVVGVVVCPAKIELPNGRFIANAPTGLISPIPEEILEALNIRTDKAGIATFDHFPDWSWNGFRCQSVDFGVQEFAEAHSVKDSDELRLQLSPVGSIRGRIISKDLTRFNKLGFSFATRSTARNQPSNGRRTRNLSKTDASGVATGQIDERGEFIVPAIAAGYVGEFRIYSADDTLQDVDLVCDNFHSRKVLPNTALELNIETPATVTVSGVVLTSDTRKPVKGAIISTNRNGGPHLRSFTTNEQGEFRFNVVPGKVELGMIHLGDAWGGRYNYAEQFPEEVTEETKLELLLPVNKQVKGKLQDAAGRPIPNQRIGRFLGLLYQKGGGATTDAEGNFEMYIRSWPVQESVSWAIVDNAESEMPKHTSVTPVYSNDDFLVLERPNVPLQPPKTK